MIDYLAGIADFILSICQFIYNTFASIFWLIGSIPNFTSTLVSLFAYCPSPLLVFLEVSLSLTILFAVIKLIK